jgi:prevent-host-death family protein
MPTVDIARAKNTLPKLVKAIESGTESEIVITRDGKPVAKLVPLSTQPVGGIRFGLLENKYPPLDFKAFQALDAEIEAMFYADPSWEPKR